MLTIQQRADQMQARARVNGQAATRRAAAKLQSRADRLRKIDKAILRALPFLAWSTFGVVCARCLVAPGAHLRADYAARLSALVAAGKVERRGRQPNVEYRRVSVDTP